MHEGTFRQYKQRLKTRNQLIDILACHSLWTKPFLFRCREAQAGQNLLDPYPGIYALPISLETIC